MPFRRLRSLFVVLTLPLVMADAGPRCGGSSPRREPAPEDASQLDGGIIDRAGPREASVTRA